MKLFFLSWLNFSVKVKKQKIKRKDKKAPHKRGFKPKIKNKKEAIM